MELDGLLNLLDRFLANRPLNAAFLYVSPQIGLLDKATRQLQRDNLWPYLPLSFRLAETLKDIAPAKMPRQARRNFFEIFDDYQPGPVLCTDIDILFDPLLKLNPLQLFLSCSRRTTLVIAWPGSYHDHTLAYAVPEHAHYRIWPQSELCDYCVAQL